LSIETDVYYAGTELASTMQRNTRGIPARGITQKSRGLQRDKYCPSVDAPIRDTCGFSEQRIQGSP